MSVITDLSKSLHASLSGELSTIARDLGESALDSSVSNEVFKNIPVLNVAHSLYKIHNTVKENHLLRKLERFLRELSKTTEVERQEFLDRLEEDPNHRNTVFEKTIIVLDRLDEDEKAEIMARYMRAYILDIIDDSIFFRLCNVLTNGYLQDLKAMFKTKSTFQKGPTTPEFFQWLTIYDSQLTQNSLLSLGLIESKIKKTPSSGGVSLTQVSNMELETKITRLGRAVADLSNFSNEDEEMLKSTWRIYRGLQNDQPSFM